MGLKKYSLDDYIVCFTEQVKEKFFAKFQPTSYKHVLRMYKINIF